MRASVMPENATRGAPQEAPEGAARRLGERARGSRRHGLLERHGGAVRRRKAPRGAFGKRYAELGTWKRNGVARLLRASRRPVAYAVSGLARAIKKEAIKHIKTRGYSQLPLRSAPVVRACGVRYAALNMKGKRGVRVLPHAGRRFYPYGEAAPGHRGASCTTRWAPSAGSPQRRVH
jgi:hypothetical protein